MKNNFGLECVAIKTKLAVLRSEMEEALANCLPGQAAGIRLKVARQEALLGVASDLYNKQGQGMTDEVRFLCLDAFKVGYGEVA